MSAPLILSPDSMRDISSALIDFSHVARRYGVTIGAYGEARITHRTAEGHETVFQVTYVDDVDDKSPFCYIDDRIGG